MISRDNILKILDSWSFWNKPAPTAVTRTWTSTRTLRPEVVTVVQGVRRCGKSTLLPQLMSQCGVSPKSAVFANFEDPRISNWLNFELLEEIYITAIQNCHGPLMFFFDEIQNVDGWQKWMNSKLERPLGHTFVVTGSNSRLLGGELATSMTGRHITYELFPFDFEEYKKVIKKGSLTSYLRQGGFPAALKFTDAEVLLQQYFFDIIERDIRERLGAKSSQPLRALAQMVLEGVGTETSLRRLAGAVGLSPETTSQYMEACEGAYLFLGCSYFAHSEAKRIRRNKKYYCIDTGLRRAVTTRLGGDFGKDFENLVFLTLRRKNMEIYYWKGKGEVDFIVKNRTGVTPIQVTWNDPQERHHASLQEFYSEFPYAKEAIFVTPDTYEELLGLTFE